MRIARVGLRRGATLALALGLGATGLSAQAPGGPGASATAGAGKVVGASTAAVGAPAKTMTLDQVVAAALATSPQVVQGKGAVKNAAAGQRAAEGEFLPSVSLSTGASLSSSGLSGGTDGLGTTGLPANAAATTTHSYTAGVQASLDVFDGGKRTADLARSRAEAEEADAGLLQQKYAVTLAAKTDFYDVLRAQELVTVSQSQEQTARDALSAAQDRLKAGAATRSDILRAQLALTQAQQALSQAQSQQTTAEYALGRDVGYDGSVLPHFTGSLQPRPLALTEAQLDSLVTTQAPAVHAAQAAVKASTASVGAAKSAYLPQLQVAAGYDWADRNAGALGQTAGVTGSATSWDVSASVTLPVFDGFQREQAVTQAKVATKDAQATLVDQRRAQRVELQKDLAALKDAQNQITLGEQAVKSAQEDLRVQQERYGLGASTMLDVITSQSALAQAQQGLVNARYDYQVSRASIEALAGRSL